MSFGGSQSMKRAQLPDYDDDNNEQEERRSKRKRNERSSPPKPSPIILNSSYYQIKLPGQFNSSTPTTSESSKDILNQVKTSPVKFSSSRKSHSRSNESSWKSKHSIEKSHKKDIKRSHESKSDFNSSNTSLKNTNVPESYKSQFERLAKAQKLSYDNKYLVQLSVSGQLGTFTSSSYRTVQQSEEDVFRQALQALKKRSEPTLPKKPIIMKPESVEKMEPMEAVESSFIVKPAGPILPNSDFANQLKSLLLKQEDKTLFKTEFPVEYEKLFKYPIQDNWFDLISQRPDIFKVDNLGPKLAYISLR